MVGFIFFVGLWLLCLYAARDIWRWRRHREGAQFLKATLVLGLVFLAIVFGIAILMLDPGGGK